MKQKTRYKTLGNIGYRYRAMNGLYIIIDMGPRKAESVDLWFSQWPDFSPFFSFFSQHAIDWTVDSFFCSFSVWVIHELRNAGFNILSYCIEAEKLFEKTFGGTELDDGVK